MQWWTCHAHGTVHVFPRSLAVPRCRHNTRSFDVAAYATRQPSSGPSVTTVAAALRGCMGLRCATVPLEGVSDPRPWT